MGGGEVREGAGRIAEGLTCLTINSFTFVLYRYDMYIYIYYINIYINKLMQTIIGPTLGLK